MPHTMGVKQVVNITLTLVHTHLNYLDLEMVNVTTLLFASWFPGRTSKSWLITSDHSVQAVRVTVCIWVVKLSDEFFQLHH